MTSAPAQPAGVRTRLPGTGEEICIFDDCISVLLDGRTTDASWAVCLVEVAPGGGPPLHRHPGAESFLVLTGSFEISSLADGRIKREVLGPGTFFHVPSGSPHGWRNLDTGRSTLACMLDPALLAFFADFGAAFPPGTPGDLAQMLSIYTRHGVELVPDPEAAHT
jgi:quercetin dioxygenase-like cupin family protein